MIQNKDAKMKVIFIVRGIIFLRLRMIIFAIHGIIVASVLILVWDGKKLSVKDMMMLMRMLVMLVQIAYKEVNA